VSSVGPVLNGGPDFGDVGDDGRSLAEDERY
jgi:hypothetical protein